MLHRSYSTEKLLLILSFLNFQLSAQSWVKVESLPSVWMTAIAADENKLWVAGTDKLYYLSEGGSVWDSTVIIHPELQYISDILSHGGVIFITDESKGIFKSEDQGLSWQNYNQGLNFTHMIGGAVRGDSIYTGTIGAGIYLRNLNSNHGWQHFSSGIHWQNTESITNINGTLVAGAGSNATLYINEAQESDWTEVQFAEFNGSINALLAIIEVDNKWIAAGNNGLYTSSDNGQNWTPLNIQTGFIGQARFLYHEDVIYAHLAKVQSSKLYYSLDNGNSWNDFFPSLNNGLDIIFWNNQFWYATQNGLWNLHTSTGINYNENAITNFTSFPNPFTNVLNIEVFIKVPGYYKIEIQSTSGNQTLILQEKWLEAGRHEIKWNSNNTLIPGIYILKVANQTTLKILKVVKTE